MPYKPKSKYSPYPWRAVQEGNYCKVVDADDEIVSDLRLIHHPASLHPKGWNNACCMAAAPELAVVLEKLVAECLESNPKDATIREAMAILEKL